jgi:hypothetical protein
MGELYYFVSGFRIEGIEEIEGIEGFEEFRV